MDKKTLSKECFVCKVVFNIPCGYSIKQITKRKYCNIKCAVKDRKPSQYKSGWKHSNETKEKISKHFKGKFRSNTYGSIHTWLLKNFTKHNCERCGSNRFVEFALKKGCEHQHDRDNYLCLCSSCHKKYDYTNERKIKLSNSLKGRKIYWIDKIAKANFGKKRSEEHKKRVSEVQKIYTLTRKRNCLGQYV